MAINTPQLEYVLEHRYTDDRPLLTINSHVARGQIQDLRKEGDK
jgi:hypothetical protein